MQQVYIPSLRPTSNTPEDLLSYCIKKIIKDNLLSDSFTHNQWAGKLFSYEKLSYQRVEFMSIVKREFPIYFTRLDKGKYSFIEEKLKRDYPSLFGLSDNSDDDEGSTCEEIVEDNIKSLTKEIAEQKNPENIESFSGTDLSMIRQQGKSYVYQVKLTLTDGQEPHFHEGIPFTLKVYQKSILCEAVDFDYENGLLFFTSARYLTRASYCRVLLDSTFILEGLMSRLREIADDGIDDKLPFTKFMFDETEELVDIKHKKVPARISRNLDDAQKEAFNAAIDKDITFIWGPPGTGKSYTLASIIYALYDLKEDRTAVCCLSNVAVDQLLNKVVDIIDNEERILTPGEIYRAGRTRDDRILSTDYLFPEDDLTKSLRRKIKQNNEELKWLKASRRDMTERAILLKVQNKDWREELKVHTEFLVKSSRVVFSTISNFVLSSSLNGSHFDNLIVDEASMLSMPSLIALASKITKRLIMVGDFQQLSPIAIVKDGNLKDSVFEMNGIDIQHTNHPGLHQLLHQRRSNERIVNLINDIFYKNKLIATIHDKDSIVDSVPFPGKVIALSSVEGGAVRFTKGGTRQNKAFAENIMDLLDAFEDKVDSDYTIGIITPYRGQVALLRALLHERDYPEEFTNRIKIGTVHTFQGSECDVIIYDMVECGVLESGKRANIGRIYSSTEGERLLNVAVSRAKHKLIIVCDPAYMTNIPGNTITIKTRKVLANLCNYR